MVRTFHLLLSQLLLSQSKYSAPLQFEILRVDCIIIIIIIIIDKKAL